MAARSPLGRRGVYGVTDDEGSGAKQIHCITLDLLVLILKEEIVMFKQNVRSYLSVVSIILAILSGGCGGGGASPSADAGVVPSAPFCFFQGQTYCLQDRLCHDLRTDLRNCGACGTSCPLEKPYCNDGACDTKCDVGDLSLCNNKCVHLSKDPENCGKCGIPCPSNSCEKGKCLVPVMTCDGGGGIDPLNDDNNCGGCGIKCPGPSFKCYGGYCRCDEVSYFNCDRMPGNCFDLSKDPRNCGLCNAPCPGALQCIGGRCVCPGAQVDCGGTCTDLITDVKNCGGCGQSCKSPAHGTATCLSGKCVVQCAEGWAQCSPMSSDCLINLQMDPRNCGSCGKQCTAGANCNNGICG